MTERQQHQWELKENQAQKPGFTAGPTIHVCTRCGCLRSIYASGQVSATYRSDGTRLIGARILCPTERTLAALVRQKAPSTDITARPRVCPTCMQDTCICADSPFGS